jgi:hypothetical protein
MSCSSVAKDNSKTISFDALTKGSLWSVQEHFLGWICYSGLPGVCVCVYVSAKWINPELFCLYPERKRTTGRLPRSCLVGRLCYLSRGRPVTVYVCSGTGQTSHCVCVFRHWADQSLCMCVYVCSSTGQTSHCVCVYMCVQALGRPVSIAWGLDIFFTTQ